MRIVSVLFVYSVRCGSKEKGSRVANLKLAAGDGRVGGRSLGWLTHDTCVRIIARARTVREIDIDNHNKRRCVPMAQFSSCVGRARLDVYSAESFIQF